MFFPLHSGLDLQVSAEDVQGAGDRIHVDVFFCACLLLFAFEGLPKEKFGSQSDSLSYREFSFT